MNHWARSYIGKPHAMNAEGPRAFSCWGLLRDIFRTRHGLDLPHVAVGAVDALTENARAIKEAAQISGFRRVTRDPQDGDVVVMRSRVELHCGYVLSANGKIGVLHASHAVGVVWQPWSDAVEGMITELWSNVR